MEVRLDERNWEGIEDQSVHFFSCTTKMVRALRGLTSIRTRAIFAEKFLVWSHL